MSKRVIGAGSLVVGTLLILVSVAGPASASWTVSTLDTGGRKAVGIAHAFDADGAPAVAYGLYKDPNQPPSKTKYEVRLARQDLDTGDWTTQVVDSSSSEYIGNAVDLAFDPSDGNPSLTYGTSSMKFAHYTGSAWSITTVGVKSSGSWDSSIVYDPSDGGASVAYFGTTGSGKNAVSGLKYAHQNPTTGSWTIQSVTSSSGGSVQLAFDASGNPAIAYSAGGYLNYASRSGGTWSTETVESGGFNAGLAFDPATGYPVLVHEPSAHTRIVTYTGSDWSGESFDGTGSNNYTKTPSIAFNGSVVLYLSWTDSEVYLSHRTSTGWDTEGVDSTTWSNSATHLVFDGAGNPSISYNGNNASPYPRLAVAS